MTKYNHAYSIAFSLVSSHEEGEDVTMEMLRAAIERRMDEMDSSGNLEWFQAIGAPFDTYKEE